MAARGRRALRQGRATWIRAAAEQAFRGYADPPRDRPRDLAHLIEHLPAWLDARERGLLPERVRHWYLAPTAMGTSAWPVAPLHTLDDLEALVGLTPNRIRWYADPQSRERSVDGDRLRHYRYRWLPKRSGGARLIEEPKPMLKHLQRVILREVLAAVPLHAAAHGFRPGHSALTYASGHTGRATVVHLDLEDFFASVGAGRIYGLYRSCGYPEDVAHLLTALGTNAAPTSVVAHSPSGAVRTRLSRPHLPQGAPTSPTLANLAAFRLDRRLTGLAESSGLRYSRYADDLAFSSGRPLRPSAERRLLDGVAGIVADEGFGLNRTKTWVRSAGQRQRLTGVIVNERPNIDRRDYDRLKAVLTNCARHGPHGQNRAGVDDLRSHLEGRIAWVAHLHPARGARLRSTFDRIDWSDRPATDH